MAPIPESRQVVTGEEVRLECHMAQAGEVIWLKGTEPIQPSGRFQVLCQGQQQTLVIQGFSAEDQGEYICGPACGPPSAAAAAFQGASRDPAGWGSGTLGRGGRPALLQMHRHSGAQLPVRTRLPLRPHPSLRGLLANAACGTHCLSLKPTGPYTLSPSIL